MESTGEDAISSVQSLSRVWISTPWIAARQASLSITNSWSSLKLMSIESVMPSSPLILCHPLLLLPPIPSSIRVFSNESTVRMRWPKYWSFSFSIIPSKEIPGLISFRWRCYRVIEMTTKNLAYDINLDDKAAAGLERIDSSFERHSINTVHKMLSTSISHYTEIIHDRKMWLCHSHPKPQQPLPQSVSSHKYQGKANTTNKRNSLKIQMSVSFFLAIKYF